jgi:hypothetical protein
MSLSISVMVNAKMRHAITAGASGVFLSNLRSDQEQDRIDMSDLWQWRVTYGDGSILDEYDESGQDHGWCEVLVESVVKVELLPQVAGLSMHVLLIPQNRLPIFFRRRMIGVNQDGSEGSRQTIHCLGFQGHIYQFIFENGATLLTDDFNAV